VTLMQIWIDPQTNQIRAVYRPGPYTGKAWAEKGLVPATVKDTANVGRDHKVVRDERGAIVGYAESVNPVQPTPRPPRVDPRDAKIADLEAATTLLLSRLDKLESDVRK